MLILFGDQIFSLFPVTFGRRSCVKYRESHDQPIYLLPREFQEKNKNTEDKTDHSLTDLGISLGKQVSGSLRYRKCLVKLVTA